MKKKTLLIDLISKLTDPQLKTQYMNKLKDLLTNETKERKIIKNKDKLIFSLNKTLEMFKNPVKEITLPELNQEVNKLKKEIK